MTYLDFIRFSGTAFSLAQRDALPNPVALRETQKLRFRHQTQDLSDAVSKDCKRAEGKAAAGGRDAGDNDFLIKPLDLQKML